MKKLPFATIIASALLLTGCTLKPISYQNNQGNNQGTNPPEQGNNQAAVAGSYVGSFYQGNYVWGGAMNLAWNEMADSIIKATVKLDTTDPTALAMVTKFNARPFTKQDLDEPSYYIKSGFGQATVDTINRESRTKFPDKSFRDLQLDLADSDFIAYAYFLKVVEYVTQFKEQDVTFAGENVQGFLADNKIQKENLQILRYDSDDKFIVALRLKDGGDQLILAKGYNMQDPMEAVTAVQAVANNKIGFGIADAERFEMPKLHLDYQRVYEELVGKSFANEGFTSYWIDQMFENIKFDMDHKGARVENEAVIVGTTSIPIEPPVIRNFILDKPFWVVMKRTDRQQPYFILGVTNTNLMQTVN